MHRLLRTLASALAVLLPSLLTTLLTTTAANAQRNPFDDLVPELSPFTAVDLQDDGYHVQVDGTWYLLVALNDVDAGEYIEFCEDRYGDRAEKRFAEDLVAVMIGMGQKVVFEVDLELQDLETGELVERTEKMTKDNRRAVWNARNGRPGIGIAVPAIVRRLVREHATELDPRYADLATGVVWDGWKGRQTILRAQAEADLDQLEWSVVNEHSYAGMLRVDVDAAFDAVRLGLQDEMAVADFAERVARLTARFGDGHARVRGLDQQLPAGYLPFLLADAQGGCVAFRPDRRGFVDEERPYVRSIDGEPLEAWLAAVDDLTPVGSAANTRFRALRQLRQFAYARLRRGKEAADTLTVELVNAAGDDAKTHVLDLKMVKPTYGGWPRGASRRIGDVGYVRIDVMDGDAGFTAALQRTMESFADAEKLVIDVRGNGGGTRDALRIVMPHVRVRSHGPLVYNVAAFRLPPGAPEDEVNGHLQNRGLFPPLFERWTEAEGHAIGLAAMPFVADWELDEAAFTDWHYGVISPTEASPEAEREVIVLMDTGCFSATDIFLGAFEGLPGVTLMGTPSGGGSGRSQSVPLAHSGLQVRLSTMASFRPDGRRYDGLGIEPEVHLLPKPEDHLVGRGDSILEAACVR